jgi:hypothetical protein
MVLFASQQVHDHVQTQPEHGVEELGLHRKQQATWNNPSSPLAIPKMLEASAAAPAEREARIPRRLTILVSLSTILSFIMISFLDLMFLDSMSEALSRIGIRPR